MPRSDDTRATILHAAYRCFYRAGFARISLDEVGRAARVTKRTLYNHYDSKDSLISAALEHHAEEATLLILEWGAGDHEDPAALVAGLFGGLSRWAAGPRWQGSGYSRVVWELADMPGHPARGVARNHKRAVEAWLAGAFARLGARHPGTLARRVMLLIEGCMFLALVHDDPDYIDEAASAAQRLVEADGA